MPETEAEKSPYLFKLEEASSGRSKCKITGEKIEAGELRVGVEGYVGGRLVTNWIKPQAFLEKCFVEYSPNARAKCKKTGNTIQKDELRFVFFNGATSKAYLSLDVAGEQFAELLKKTNFDPMKFQDVDKLPDEDKKRLKDTFAFEPKEDNDSDENEKDSEGYDGEAEEKQSKKQRPRRQQKAESKSVKNSKKRKSRESSEEADNDDDDDHEEEKNGAEKPPKRVKRSINKVG